MEIFFEATDLSFSKKSVSLQNQIWKMKTRQEYIEILKAHESELKDKFGVSYMRVFGSVARDEQHDGGDVDVISDVVNNDLQPLLEAIDYFVEYLKNKV